MAVIVKTARASELLSGIKKGIDAGSIETWSYDSEGDFTHSPDQWKYKAWLRPVVRQGELYFNFIGNTKVRTTSVIYAVYHGRFAEMLLSHFDTKFTNVQCTALPANGDAITSEPEV